MTKRQHYHQLIGEGFTPDAAATISGWDEYRDFEEDFWTWCKYASVCTAVIVVGVIGGRML